jgi:hypothetical protein
VQAVDARLARCAHDLATGLPDLRVVKASWKSTAMMAGRLPHPISPTP